MTRRFRLTHLDDDGRPTMVDVSEKDRTLRRAEAEGWVLLDEAVCASLDSEGTGRKGNVLRVAELAGIMAVKRTPDLIPLCHGIRIDSVSVACDLLREERRIRIRCSVTARDVTGVAMEALTGVSVAALTVYDMCKAASKAMTIEGVRLVMKSGGKSGTYRAAGVDDHENS